MSADRKLSETFSSVDAAWLHMDTPTNLAVITGVLTFPGRLDEARLIDVIERRLLSYTRFKMRVRERPLTLGLPTWEVDPDFSLDHHLIRQALPEPVDHTALQEFVGELVGRPLDRRRPLWQFHLVDLEDGGAALICRLHHCIADGLALVQVLLSIADLSPEGEDTPPLETPAPQRRAGLLRRLTSPARWAARTVRQGWRLTGTLAHEGMEMLIHPSKLRRAATLGVGATRSLGKLLLIPPDRRTRLRGQCGVEKRAAWSVAIDLEEVKGIGRLMGGTVNDILLSALTGALRRYLELHGGDVHRLNIRGVVPVSLRPTEQLDKLGNQFGLVFLSLPVGIEDPIKRLIMLKRRMNQIKDTPEALVAFGILGGMGLTPVQIEQIIISIFAMKGTAVLTNVPGPRHPLYIAGQLIDTLMFWVPTPGNLGLGVSIISYNGRVMMGVATDAGLIPDPQSILDSFIDELEYLKRWGRPPERLEPGPEVETSAEAETEEPAVDAAETVVEAGQCQALTRAGQRCKKRARPGHTTCGIHREQEGEPILG